MKKKAAILVALAACLLVAVDASARKRWDFGLKGGLNVAGLYGSDADTIGTDTRTGVIVGAFVTMKLNPGVGIRLEGHYAQKGAKRALPEGELTAKIDYIDVPLLVVFQREMTEDTFWLNMHVGPVLSFKVSAGGEVSAGGTYAGRDIDDITKNFDYGGAVGIGGAWNVGRFDVVIDARYTVSFVSIDDAGEDLDFRNNAFSALAGVAVPLGYR
jgi:hypothetical protein